MKFKAGDKVLLRNVRSHCLGAYPMYEGHQATVRELLEKSSSVYLEVVPIVNCATYPIWHDTKLIRWIWSTEDLELISGGKVIRII